jgi:hypothetical protein
LTVWPLGKNYLIVDQVPIAPGGSARASQVIAHRSDARA